MTEHQKAWHEKNKPRKRAYMKAYRARNPDAVRASVQECYAKCGDKYAATRKRWQEKNRAKVAAYKKQWAKDNRDRVTKQAREYSARRRETDDNFKLKMTLRCRIYSAIRSVKGRKSARMIELLGCTVDFLRGYLEARFLPGMTWENHGKWHIDHHVPCAEFDLRDPAQQRQCFHYSNLKPMWGVDNLRKGKKRPVEASA